MIPRLVNRMRLRFGAPRHGWLRGTLIADDDAVDFEGSDTPADWIAELVWTLDALACGHDCAGVAISAEATECRLLFEMENGLVRTRLIRRGSGVTLVVALDVLVVKSKVLLSFWRGLRELESRMAAGAPGWRYRFPSDELDRLHEKLVMLYP
ncbi:hypothetical protein [Sorangium sp. So ce362]|uniref:hypothetical protein n=1 Tax=Sorangium sp. So ce362 TaxID=3133303 RepID=UPI003F5DF3A5